MKVGLDRDLLEILGHTTERPMEFPQPGGAYDSYSRLIFTRIEGNQTYKRRLEVFWFLLQTLNCRSATNKLRAIGLSIRPIPAKSNCII